jgi:hypothetical protein
VTSAVPETGETVLYVYVYVYVYVYLVCMYVYLGVMNVFSVYIQYMVYKCVNYCDTCYIHIAPTCVKSSSGRRVDQNGGLGETGKARAVCMCVCVCYVYVMCMLCLCVCVCVCVCVCMLDVCEC